MPSNKKEYPSETAVQLIPHLSEGVYTTFAKAVKELVMNSFDADASEVNIDFNDDFSGLIISDNGDGISQEKFKEQLFRVAGSKRRLESRSRKYPRPIMGRFGIGFLSTARLCKTAKVISKEKGNNFGIVREIPLEHLFEDSNQLKNLKEEYYFYSLPNFPEDKNKSYTKIELLGLRPGIQQDLKSSNKFNDTWSNAEELSGIERFKWDLGILLPVKYAKEYPIYKKSISSIDRAKLELDKFVFRVFMNKKEILKPICLGHRFFKDARWEYPKNTVQKSNYNLIPIESPAGSTFKFFGYIYNQSKQIQPSSLRGLLLRINHVGIKGYSKSLFEYTKNIGPIPSAISGEIFLDSSLEEILTLDKDDFKEDHPLFKQLIGYLHDFIDDVAKAARKRSSKKNTKKDVSKVKDINLSSKEVLQAQKILGKEEFKNEFFPNQDISISTDIRNIKTKVKNLTGKTLDQDEAGYLIEALDCFEADCFRGAVIMAWNTGMFRIHRKIEKDVGFVKLQSIISSWRASESRKYIKDRIKNITCLDELKFYSEEMVCHLLEKMGF